MKFLTSKKYRFGQNIVLPILGEVKVSSTGEIEVEDELVESFSKFRTGFSPETHIVETNPVVTGQETTTVEEEVIDLVPKVLSEEEKLSIQNKIDELTKKMSDLKQEAAKERNQKEIDELKAKLV